MNVVVVLVVFWFPGLVFGAAIRLRGWTLVGVAPALTCGLVAVGIYLLGKLGIAWTALNVGLWVLLISALAALGSLLLARRRRRQQPAPPADASSTQGRSVRDHLLIGGGVLVGMAVGAVAFLRGMGGLNSVHQDWDAPFHANLVRWIAEHGSALPSDVGAVSNATNDPTYFYPDVYHALLALVYGPVGMPELMNLGALAVLLALPLGIAALTDAWRMPTLAVASAAAVSTWFTALPYDSFMRGPLWPYIAGVVLVPGVLAAARYLIAPAGLAGAVGVAVAVAGLIGLHTSLFFILATLVILLLFALALRVEPVDWRVTRWHALTAVVLSAVLALPWMLPALSTAKGVTSFVWPSEASVVAGFGQMITFSPDANFPQWWIGIPAITGIVLLAWHRRMVWLVAGYVIIGGLYAATVSMESELIHFLTAPFYNDHWRIAAILPIFGAVAFGQFMSSAGDTCADHIRRWRPSWSQASIATASVMVIGLVLAVLGNGAYIGRNSTTIAFAYSEGRTVSHGERAAYAWLGEHVGTNERVMNGTYDGSVWMYALSGVKPVVWQYGSVEQDTPASVLVDRLDELDSSGLVRRSLEKLNVRYVIVGEGFIRSWNKRAEGLRDLVQNHNFRVVYSNDDAVVYAIDGQRHVAAVSGR